MRWTSSGRLVRPRIILTISGPKEMLSTKCPSMISQWMQSAPAASTRWISSLSREKSEARMDGATMILCIGVTEQRGNGLIGNFQHSLSSLLALLKSSRMEKGSKLGWPQFVNVVGQAQQESLFALSR